MPSSLIEGFRKRLSIFNKPDGAPDEGATTTTTTTEAMPTQPNTPPSTLKVQSCSDTFSPPALRTLSDASDRSVCSSPAAQATSVRPSLPSPPRHPLLTPGPGSHIIHILQETRKFKVISIDNHHNSHPGALARVSQIARAALPANGASADDRASAEVDAHSADLTKPEEIRAVFEKYGQGGIWGVIHVAVRRSAVTLSRASY
jgi:hypothetical protein